MASILDRLDPWTTTGVGSLPFRDAISAVDYLAMAYGLPFCPQLLRAEGDMITEYLGDDYGRSGWTPERERERPRAWNVLLVELRRRPPAHGLVKLQVTGPVTLACALERAGGNRMPARELQRLALLLARWLAADVDGQVATLRALGFDVVLVVDEPALAMSALEDPVAAWAPLREVAPAWGLHLCCAVPWDEVEEAAPDLLSFDLMAGTIDDRAAASLERLVAREAWIAWGVVSGHRTREPMRALPRLDAALERVPEAASRSLLTPSCGTGRLTQRRERRIAVGLWDISMRMRERAQWESDVRA